MKKSFKNSTIFDYQYLDSLAEYLSKGPVSQENKILLIKKLLSAIKATEQGEKNEYYKQLKKDLTAHKALEYTIELLVKKEYAPLQTLSCDYSTGIFDALRLHKEPLHTAICELLKSELESILASQAPDLEACKNKMTFERYAIILSCLPDLVSGQDKDLQILANKVFEHMINQLCQLCDALKAQYAGTAVAESKSALIINYMLEQYEALLSDAWGLIRVQLLRASVRKRALELLASEQAQNRQAVPEQAHEHNSCDCSTSHT